MEISEIKNLTPYQDINNILIMLTEDVQEIIGGNLVGLYLTGSLTYGDFNPDSSDIDFLAIMHRPLTEAELQKLAAMHEKIGEAYPKWAKRLEISYTTEQMLAGAPPPQIPLTARPYFNFGKFWQPPARYGQEWTINLYALYETGVALIGPSPKDIIQPVTIEAVRIASRRDFFEDRLPKLNDPEYFKNSLYHAYLILSLCRILHRDKNAGIASKKVAAAWVKQGFGQWKSLIEKAENWHHGTELSGDTAVETKKFIRFVHGQLNKQVN